MSQYIVLTYIIDYISQSFISIILQFLYSSYMPNILQNVQYWAFLYWVIMNLISFFMHFDLVYSHLSILFLNPLIIWFFMSLTSSHHPYLLRIIMQFPRITLFWHLPLIFDIVYRYTCMPCIQSYIINSQNKYLCALTMYTFSFSKCIHSQNSFSPHKR